MSDGSKTCSYSLDSLTGVWVLSKLPVFASDTCSSQVWTSWSSPCRASSSAQTVLCLPDDVQGAPMGDATPGSLPPLLNLLNRAVLDSLCHNGVFSGVYISLLIVAYMSFRLLTHIPLWFPTVGVRRVSMRVPCVCVGASDPHVKYEERRA